MFRSYRSIILAIAGLILIGAGGKPTPRADTKQAQAAQPVASKADNTDPIVPKTDKSESKDHGCKQGQDDRQSDLCAQWKAADAATDAARSSDTQTFIGWIGLLLGGITMGAAIAAAIFAKKAADHTQTGANAAVEQVRSNRAWITYHKLISGTAIQVQVGDVFMQNGLIIAPEWRNTGLSPAINASCCNIISIAEIGSAPPHFDCNGSDRAAAQTFGPNAPISGKAAFLNDHDAKLFRERKIIAYLYSRVDYQDIHNPGTTDRFSEICLSIQYASNDPKLHEPQLNISVVGPQNKTT